MNIGKFISRFRFSKIVLSLTLLLFTFTACQDKAQETRELPSDTEITEAIKAQFKASEEIPAEEINVSTEDGVVTLSGSTSNLLAKKKATEIAQSARGVLSVVSNLTITVSRPDEELSQAVAHQLATNPVTEYWEVSNSVNNGLVSLKGVVDSWQERKLVEKLVMDVKGVKEINNTIIVKPDPVRSDEDIKKEISQTLKMDSRLGANQINVQVDSGKVNLSGAVGSAQEKNLAVDIAHVTGVESVSADRLEVHPEYQDKLFKNEKLDALTANEVRSAIEKALRYDPRVPETQIDVTVEGETAILSGTVQNLNAKLAAESDARHTAGVATVENNINVERKVVISPDIPTTDEAIKERVKIAINNDPYVHEAVLTVNVEKGIVELTGDVNSQFEKNKVEDVVRDIKGVIAIDNELNVVENENT